jgi:prevent-host-death family protein
MVERWKKDPTFLQAYAELDTEVVLLRELLLARQQAGLSQAGVAKKMGTKAPAVTRLETSLSGSTHSPTIATLKKYAKAVGCTLEIRLVRRQVAERKARFLITKSGKPTAVLLSATDFDDILEELDPEFQQSLTAAAKEYRAGKAVSLRDYLKSRLSARRAG